MKRLINRRTRWTKNTRPQPSPTPKIEYKFKELSVKAQNRAVTDYTSRGNAIGEQRTTIESFLNSWFIFNKNGVML